MNDDSDSILDEEERSIFQPFTRESLAAIDARIDEENAKKKELQKKKEEGEVVHQDEDEDDGPQPDPTLEAGNNLPMRIKPDFPPELIGVPIEDIDPFYQNQRTFVVVNKGLDIYRFSASSSLWILDPFNSIRRSAIYILTHSMFSLIIMTTIISNCVVMSMPTSETIESSEILFTAIYTFESGVKLMARGFILAPFTYLRDAWNWLDFVVIALAFITMGINLGNLAALRTFRVLRALKTVAIVPGLKTIVGAVIESVKNLRDVIILTMFSLSVFALVGLQIYMGVLTHKCIRHFEDMNTTTVIENGVNKTVKVNMTYEQWYAWNSNSSNWLPNEKSDMGDYILCGNSSGAGKCPEGHTCLEGFGPNPNYGYTTFDTFGYAMLASFRLMTQDYWENLYQLVLRTAGAVHLVFFIVVIFMNSYYLLNLILAIVAMSYDQLERRAEEERLAEEAAVAERERQEEAKAERQEARARGKGDGESVGRSPSPHSCRSDELFVGQEKDRANTRERMSIKSEMGIETMVDQKPRANGKIARKGSLSLPGSPFNLRRGSRGSHQLTWRAANGRKLGDRKPLVLSTYMDAQEHLPYADDSAAVTPMSEENGTMVLPVYQQPSSLLAGSRHGSYTSHGSRRSYNSHGDLLNGRGLTKESQLRSRRAPPADSADMQNDCETPTVADMQPRSRPSENLNPFVEPVQTQPNNSVDMKDLMVLNNIIEQASQARGRRPSRQPCDLEDSDEEDEVTFKDKCKAYSVKFVNTICVWDCCWAWVKMQELLSLVVFDAFVELFITLCIVINTLFMALDHHKMTEEMDNFLKAGNYFFTATFTIEATMKLVAMSPKYYFQEGWNIFDFFIVFLSLVELGLSRVKGLSVLRSFRLLRVFKLAKSWPTLNLLISIMGQTVGAIGNLTFVLCIIVFIFAVMGMQLFGKNYTENKHLFPSGSVPRWNFTDFMHSIMIVFRVLCGEWIQSMWDCLKVSDPTCVPFFLATVVIANLVVLSLFLALLLSSFGASNLSAAPTSSNDTNKLAEAFDRIGRFKRWVKNTVLSGLKALRAKLTNQISDQSRDARAHGDGEESGAAGKTLVETAPGRELGNDGKTIAIAGSPSEKSHAIVANSIVFPPADKTITEPDCISNKSLGSHKNRRLEDGSHYGSGSSLDSYEKRNRDDLESGIYGDELDENGRVMDTTSDNVQANDAPADCFTEAFYVRCPSCRGNPNSPFWQGWATLRLKTYRLIENKYFETAVITMILLSSMALALEDVNLKDNPVLQDILYYMDRIFTVIFFIEMLVKWLAFGFKKYFTNAWCWLDFLIVMVSLINLVATLAGQDGLQAFKTMRTLRALRPLRAMSRMQGMKVVVNALIQAIPSIFNVLLVCLIFWLIFAIMGVQLFAGQYHKCVDENDEIYPVEVIDDEAACNNTTGAKWKNSEMNFDNVGYAYLSLFQVATFKGWTKIMADATDARGLGKQPSYEKHVYMYIYFVFFIIFGAFFTLNLFIGVIIDNFNEQKKKISIDSVIRLRYRRIFTMLLNVSPSFICASI